LRPRRAEHGEQRARIQEVALVQRDAARQVRDALEVLGARAADHAVHRVALVEQELGEVGAVLAGDAGDECGAGAHECFPSASPGGASWISKKPRLRNKRSVSAITSVRKMTAAVPSRLVNETAITQKHAVRNQIESTAGRCEPSESSSRWCMCWR